MNSCLSALVATALIGGAAGAEPTPAPAAKPAPSARPAPAVKPAAAPAAPGASAAKPASVSGASARYVQAAGSSLGFAFEQAGAQNNGSFRQFATTFDYDPNNLGASRLDVKIQVGSLDTQDKERDTTLASADLFDTAKYPTASYSASSLTKSASGIEAVGRLTIRNVTKDLRIPLAIRPAGAGLELSGAVTIKRLDFGVGQGEWQSTDSVGNDVKITYKVLLTKAGG